MIPPPHSSIVSRVLGSRLVWGRGGHLGTGGSVEGAQGGDPEEEIWEGGM